MDTLTLHVIARFQGECQTKFGVPRQSGLVEALRGNIVFAPEYRQEEALRGLSAFSHIWLVWAFSEHQRDRWSPTVRPPRLGGNTRMGVFATRSPFRPNPLGLSCVKLEEILPHTPHGPVLRVSGADLMDGTPIFDIKPYVPYADCRPDAVEGFATRPEPQLHVVYAPGVSADLLGQKREALEGVLAYDPRPPYQHDPSRTYGMAFADWEIQFSVAGQVLTVRAILPRSQRASDTSL